MTKEYFIEIAKFNIWANDIVHSWLNKISDEQWEQPIVSSFGSIGDTALHIAGAEKAWFERLDSKGVTFSWLPSEFKGSKNELLEIWKTVSKNIENFIVQFDENGMKEKLTFKRLNGDENTMAYYEIFAHVLNHSTFHRGQIVTMLRQVGFTEVGSTDLLGFFRQKK